MPTTAQSVERYREADIRICIHDRTLAPSDEFVRATDHEAALASANAVNAAKHQHILELQMLAWKWQEAHDKLKAGEPYSFPSPANLPDALAANTELRDALRRLLANDCPLTGNPPVAELYRFWEGEKLQGRGEADDMLFALEVLARAGGGGS